MKRRDVLRNEKTSSIASMVFNGTSELHKKEHRQYLINANFYSNSQENFSVVLSRGDLGISGRERKKDIRKLVLDMNGGSLHSPVAKLGYELDQGDGIEA